MNRLVSALFFGLLCFGIEGACEIPKPDALKSQILSSLKNGRYFDAQSISLIGLSFYPDPTQKTRFSVWRAYSLLKLGDIPEAHRLLSDPYVRGGPFHEKVEFFDHWINLQTGDRANFESWLQKKPSDLQARGKIYLAFSGDKIPSEKFGSLSFLDSDKSVSENNSNANRSRALDQSIARLQALELQSPTTNAVLSALLPGLGHARLGRFQDAALTFALNFIAIGTTVELARKDLDMPAVAAGSLASLFYVGGISSAWRLTKERNAEAKSAELGKMEQILFPELSLDF